jgi:hypothetical protein
MRAGYFVAIALAISGPVLPQAARAQSNPAPAAAADAAVPAVAEQADRLLREMGAYVGSAEQFTFHADIAFDHVLPSGQKLQFSAAEDVALERPGRLHVEWSGDLGARRFWYDGTSVTLYDPATPFYATEAASPDIDGMLDGLEAQLNFPRRSPTFYIATPTRPCAAMFNTASISA